MLPARLGRDARPLVARLAQEPGLVVVGWGEEHADGAVEAFIRFGTGRHPAALDLGDRLTYAVASLAGEPLPCRGGDLARADLELA